MQLFKSSLPDMIDVHIIERAFPYAYPAGAKAKVKVEDRLYTLIYQGKIEALDPKHQKIALDRYEVLKKRFIEDTIKKARKDRSIPIVCGYGYTTTDVHEIVYKALKKELG